MRVLLSLAHGPLRSACLFGALTLVHCSASEDAFETPASGGKPTGTTGGSAPLQRGGASGSSATLSTGGSSGGASGNSATVSTGGSSGGAIGGGSGASGAPATGGSAGLASGGNTGLAGSAGAAGMAPTAACAAKPGALRGKSNQMVTAAGVQRTFVYYAPSNLAPNAPAPVVIVAHGWTMSGQQMYDITQYHTLAEREGFVLMYPDGEPASIGPWNIGDGACPSSLAILPLGAGDDQAFIDGMIAFAEADQCIDRKHVFVTGFSMGGYFANEVGCLRKDIAAVAPHSGGSHDFSACPTMRKPVIIFHGTMDGLIPVTCGKEARDRWVKLNGCGTEVDSVNVMGGHCEYSKGCPVDGQVALCLFDGMDHGWAGGQGSANAFPNYESASTLGWEFFKKYGW